MHLQVRFVALCCLRAALVVLLLLVNPLGSGATTPALVTSLQLPVDLATEIAGVALQACSAQGAAVSVSLVDERGQLQVFLRGDGAAPHTAQLSEHKAYTAVSLAALQGFHTTSELVDAMHRSRSPIGALPLPADSITAITPVPGGIVLRHDQLVAGLGVSGARQGEIDEQCALAAERWLDGRFVSVPDQGGSS